MDVSKMECKRILRALELKAYRNVVDALIAQGSLTSTKHEVLKNLAETLQVSDERHRSEIRRAINDDLLNTIASGLNETNTKEEWQTESLRRIPLTPMIAPNTAFTVLADSISDLVVAEDEKFDYSINSSSNNVLETFRNRAERNYATYNLSNSFGTLLRKRQSHHREAIISELERIKLNNYPGSKAVLIGNSSQNEEISGADKTSEHIAETRIWQNADWSEPCTSRNSKIAGTRVTSVEQNEVPKINDLPSGTGIINRSKAATNHVDVQNSAECGSLPVKTNFRSLRIKPLTKYSIDKVEIMQFKETPDVRIPKSTSKIVNSVQKKTLGEGKNSFKNSAYEVDKNISNSVESESAIKFNSQPEVLQSNTKSSKILNRRGRKRKSRVKYRSMQSRLARSRKINTSQRLKPEVTNDSSINAIEEPIIHYRDDSVEFDDEFRDLKSKRDKKSIKVQEANVNEPVPVDDNLKSNSEASNNEDTDTDAVEVSYTDSTNNKVDHTTDSGNRNADTRERKVLEFDGISPYLEDDDTRPHTFNLIPASRRLKLLRKRQLSPADSEILVKKNSFDKAFSSCSNSTFATNEFSALEKVLKVEETLGDLKSCDLNELHENVKELKRITERICSVPTNPIHKIDFRSDAQLMKIFETMKETLSTPQSERTINENLNVNHNSDSETSTATFTGDNDSDKWSECDETPTIDIKIEVTDENLEKTIKKADQVVCDTDTTNKKTDQDVCEPDTMNKKANQDLCNTDTANKKEGEDVFGTDTGDRNDEHQSMSAENETSTGIMEDDSEDKDECIVIADNRISDEIIEIDIDNDEDETDIESIGKLSANEEIINVTLEEVMDDDDLDNLIDIESADVIIGDEEDRGQDIATSEEGETMSNQSEKMNEGISIKTASASKDCDERSPKQNLVLVNIGSKVQIKPLSANSEILKKPGPRSRIRTKALSDIRYLADVDEPLLKSTTPDDASEVTTALLSSPLTTAASASTSKRSSSTKVENMTASIEKPVQGNFKISSLNTNREKGPQSLRTNVVYTPSLTQLNNTSNVSKSILQQGSKFSSQQLLTSSLNSTLKNINLTKFSNLTKTIAVIKKPGVASIAPKKDSVNVKNPEDINKTVMQKLHDGAEEIKKDDKTPVDADSSNTVSAKDSEKTFTWISLPQLMETNVNEFETVAKESKPSTDANSSDVVSPGEVEKNVKKVSMSQRLWHIGTINSRNGICTKFEENFACLPLPQLLEKMGAIKKEARISTNINSSNVIARNELEKNSTCMQLPQSLERKLKSTEPIRKEPRVWPTFEKKNNSNLIEISSINAPDFEIADDDFHGSKSSNSFTSTFRKGNEVLRLFSSKNSNKRSFTMKGNPK